jgi:hypothetical protein
VPTITRKIVHDFTCYKINFLKRKMSEKIEAAGWELGCCIYEAGTLLENGVVRKALNDRFRGFGLSFKYRNNAKPTGCDPFR